jgi:hypothetical protein
MIKEDELISLLSESINNEKILFVKDAFNLNCDWNKIVLLLDKKFNSAKNIKAKANIQINSTNGRVTDILDYESLFFHVWHIENKEENNMEIFPELQLFNENILNKINYNNFGLKASITFVSNGHVIREHADIHHSLFLGALGTSNITIRDKENIIKDYELNANDLMLIPKGFNHTVISYVPRVSFIYDSEVK